MDQILTSEVYGRIIQPNGGSGDEVVGAIFSEYPLDSSVFEIVTLDFDKNYNGVECNQYNQAGAVLTFAKTIGGYSRDIVSPIVMITSKYQIPLHILSSGVISRVNPPTVKRTQLVVEDGSCSIVIIIPGKSQESVTEYSVRIPRNVRIDRKVLYIKKFNIYVSGCSVEQMMEIRDNGILRHENINPSKTIVDIHIKGYVTSLRTMYFNFNGIQGKCHIEPSREPLGTITLRIAGTTLTKQITNGELLNMENSIYFHWDDFGGIDLLIDNDRDRLHDFYKSLKEDLCINSPDAAVLTGKLRKEISDLKEKLQEKELAIKELKHRMAEEEFKIKREELRYHGTIVDQRNAVIMDTIKLGGALLGVVSVAITLASKAAKSTNNKSISVGLDVLNHCIKCTMVKKGLIEWANPLLLKGK